MSEKRITAKAAHGGASGLKFSGKCQNEEKMAVDVVE